MDCEQQTKYQKNTKSSVLYSMKSFHIYYAYTLIPENDSMATECVLNISIELCVIIVVEGTKPKLTWQATMFKEYVEMTFCFRVDVSCF